MRRVEFIMGTAISIEIAGSPASAAELADETFAWFREVDQRFSTYLAESEVSRFSRGELSAKDASLDFQLVLRECARLRSVTDGYFDAYATGRFDPSGYVKGWSVQVASDRLLAAGAGDHCLNAGGDIRLRGRRWRVGIRHPWEPAKVAWVLAGADLAIATSGTYERGLHVINPRLGKPADELCSVTVVGQDLGLVDAYATAAMAMGEAGLDWLAALDGYSSAAITNDGRAFVSEGLPLADQ